MCLILFAYQQHPDHPLIVAANRDEFYQRPTAALAPWQDQRDIIGGRDLQAGGTWLGLSRSGRFSAVTNIREGANPPASQRSRGQLCQHFLSSKEEPASWLRALQPTLAQFGGFNFLAGDFTDLRQPQLFFLNNRGSQPQPLRPGVYGLSNSPELNSHWPKVRSGIAALEQQLAGDIRHSQLLTLLQSQTTASDHQLPHTGIALAQERWLSSRFIQSEDYGTRTSTVLTLSYSGEHHISEQTFLAGGNRGAFRQTLFCFG